MSSIRFVYGKYTYNIRGFIHFAGVHIRYIKRMRTPFWTFLSKNVHFAPFSHILRFQKCLVYVLYTDDIRFIYVKKYVYTVYKTYAYVKLDIYKITGQNVQIAIYIRIIYASYTGYIRALTVYKSYTTRMRTGNWTFLFWTSPSQNK